jgi:DnaJ-class molecular chaperone
VETLSVKIPAGIDDGKTIRLRGQGEQVQRGTPGDLLITVHVGNHPHYQRSGNNLIVRVPVTLAEAALGAKIDLPTPHGTVAVQIPRCTSSGKKLRVKGYGVKPPSGAAGDLLVEVQIVLPPKLDPASEEAIRRVEESNPVANPRHSLQW